MDNFIISVNLIFNKEEFDLGNGFYPLLYTTNNINKIINDKININKYYYITTEFKFIDIINTNGWIQLSGNVIYGFNNYNGLEVLNYINNTFNKNGIFILNSGGRMIYPIPYNSTFLILGETNKKK
jgi:hypothetical protein